MTASTIDTTNQANATSTGEFDRAEERTAHNYHPLPVVVAHAEGAWMTDVDGTPLPRPARRLHAPSTSATRTRGCSRPRTPSSTSSP